MNTEVREGNKSWKRIFKIFIPYVLAVGILQLLGALALGLDINSPVKPQLSTFQNFVMKILDFSGTVLIIALFRKHVDKESFKSLGFDIKYFKKDILMGLVMGFSIMAAGFLILLASNQIQFDLFQFKLPDLILSIGLFILVAFTEELLIRGYVLNNFMKSFNKYIALIISAGIFSLMHGFNPNINGFAFFNLFLAGIVLGLSYIYTRNLWFPISLHFSWNFFMGTIFGFNVSGLDAYSLIAIKKNENTIWNGGSFGFEGSVFCILFQLIAIAFIFIIFRVREIKNAAKLIPKVV